ncbi:MAG TPA: IS1595 family transposase [Rickettsiales bacterium]|nr:IS1595 family transposase [Rickettsiales bacterium]
MLNRYTKHSHISERKFKEILKCFSLDLTAENSSKFTNISRNTVNKYFTKFRIAIFEQNNSELNFQNKEFGEFELDESYFGARRIRGKRGRGAAGKTPVFGLKKRNGKVYVEIVKGCSKKELMPIIQGKILEGSTIYTDGWKAYDGLILNGYDHYRVFHSHNEFARGKSHVNGIEGFWGYAKNRLAKFHGMTDNKFVLHLKECEFRFNYRNDNLYKILLKMFRKNPL